MGRLFLKCRRRDSGDAIAMAGTWWWISSFYTVLAQMIEGLGHRADLWARSVHKLRMGYALYADTTLVLSIKVRDLYIAKLCFIVSTISCTQIRLFIPFCRFANRSS